MTFPGGLATKDELERCLHPQNKDMQDNYKDIMNKLKDMQDNYKDIMNKLKDM
jgi:hypothetical protein